MKNKMKTAACVIFILCISISIVHAEETAYRGKVTEAHHEGNYSYMKLDVDGKEVWLASQPMEVSVGDEVEYIGGVPMSDFYSKGLKRTFESILFITRIKVVSGDGEDDNGKPSHAGYHESVPGTTNDIAPPAEGEIAKAENGKTIHEIISETGQLNGKEVVLRAKVMKVNKNILSKNWITLRDGTGTAPNDKLIALTSEDVHAGDVLIVRGIIMNNVDFGSGYKYEVIIGDAKFTK